VGPGLIYTKENKVIKADIHIHVPGLTLAELIALRQKIQDFLNVETRAELLIFQATESN
jgi:hypothetical protein